MKFKVGMVVCLKSGGPPMTVEPTTMRTFPKGDPINPPGIVFCIWFNGEALERAQISEECLEPELFVGEERVKSDEP